MQNRYKGPYRTWRYHCHEHERPYLERKDAQCRLPLSVPACTMTLRKSFYHSGLQSFYYKVRRFTKALWRSLKLKCYRALWFCNWKKITFMKK
jgi:hypothetical protein